MRLCVVTMFLSLTTSQAFGAIEFLVDPGAPPANPNPICLGRVTDVTFKPILRDKSNTQTEEPVPGVKMQKFVIDAGGGTITKVAGLEGFEEKPKGTFTKLSGPVPGTITVSVMFRDVGAKSVKLSGTVTVNNDTKTDSEAIAINVISVDVLVNDTSDDKDDFVTVSAGDAADPKRPFTPVTLKVNGPQNVTVKISLKAAGAGEIELSPDTLTIATGAAQSVKLFGKKKSSAENDTSIQVQMEPGGAHTCIEQDLTVITGVKIRYSGTFLFAANNNNGARAVGEMCLGVKDPEVWAFTPLACEGVTIDYAVYLSEDAIAAGAAKTRWDVASGKRPKAQVLITGVKTFGPEVDLDGRDPKLKSGIAVSGHPKNQNAFGYLIADDADNNPMTPDGTDGKDDGVEPALNVYYRFGDVLGLTYPNVNTSTIARIWTKFPAGNPGDEAADLLAINTKFLPNGDKGCESKVSYFESDGTFKCDSPLNVRGLFLLNAGFRQLVTRAWANWTSRHLKVTQEGDFKKSFAAKLFQDAVTGQASNMNADLKDDVYAETFLQFHKYDWYVLAGEVSKGVAASPGGIDPKFKEWTQSNGFPAPDQPDTLFTDDPW